MNLKKWQRKIRIRDTARRSAVVKEIRRILIIEFGESEDTCPRTHMGVIASYASKKHGVNIAGKEETRQWADRLYKEWFEEVGVDKGDITRTSSPPVRDRDKKRSNPQYDDYINKSLKWRKIRDAVLCRDKNTCLKCGIKERAMHVHHLTYEHLFHEENYLRDLATLCKECHGELHRSLRKDDINREIATIVPEFPDKTTLVFTEDDVKMAKAGAKKDLPTIPKNKNRIPEVHGVRLRRRRDVIVAKAIASDIINLASINEVRAYAEGLIAEIESYIK